MANTPYNRYASVADATPSAALAAPVFNLLPWASGTNIRLMSTSVKSPVIMPNGASAGIYNTTYWVEGTFSGQLGRDKSIDNAFQSLMMNAFDGSKVLIPAQVEKPVAYEKTFTDAGVSYFRQARGCQHSKLEIKWDAEGIVDFSTDFTGLSDSRVTAMITGASYVQPSTTKRLTGGDVSVTLGTLTGLQLKKGSISIDMARKPQTVCGTPYAVGLGVSGSRSVEYNFSFYKRDFTFETALLNNASLAVAVNLGGVGTGYKIESANVTFETPEDEDDDSGQMITVKGTAAYDVTALADVKFTQL